MAIQGDNHPFRGGGSMGALMRDLDWSQTSLGPVSTWPQSLLTTLGILLDSGYPMYIAWGDHFIQFYNDAFRPILGSSKHPAALGNSTRTTFAEIWNTIGPMFQSVMDTGIATTYTDQLMPLDRNGFTEECYFTFSYSAIREAGKVGGVLVTVLETTERVLRERRERSLQRLSALLARGTLDSICTQALHQIDKNPDDLPFAVFFSADAEPQLLRHTTTLSPHFAASLVPWFQKGPLDIVTLPSTPSLTHRSEPIERAIVIPITPIGYAQPVVYLLAGLSPRLALTSEYKSFFQRIAAALAITLAEAEAYETERKRAEALAELDRAKTAFFSNVSHEFRTPLTLMLGPLQELLERPERHSPDIIENLQLVQRNATRLQKLVNSLLDFARLESGRIEARYEPLDLAAFTVELAGVFRAAIEQAGLSFVVECPKQPCMVQVDREMWEKIVFNLLSNALKFTFEGEIRLQLSVQHEHVQLIVQDSGVGIPKDNLSQVFERFHRVQGTRARTHEGTGIGLSLVKELIALHHGEIYVESDIDRGSHFVVRIPLEQPRQVASGTSRKLESTTVGAAAIVEELTTWRGPSDQHLSAPVGRQPMLDRQDRPRILLADDNADMRDYLSRLLMEHWNVEAVGDGVEALEALRRNPPDLLLTDIMMPNLDGFELLRLVREDPELSHIPIIMLSARAGEESRVVGLNRGADDYLVKPFSARELTARVETQLVRTQLRNAEHQLNQRLAEVFHNAPVGLALLQGEQHRFDYVNIEYQKLVADREMLGKPVREAFPELEEQGFFELLDICYSSGELYIGRSVPMMLTEKDGRLTEHYVDFSYQPTYDRSGNVSGIAVIVFDVTEIARAKREAEAASRAKDEFFAMLGHELRNPLAPIMTALHLMQLSGDESFSKERGIITRQARYLTRLIDDLLDVSRISRGDITLNNAPVNIFKIVDMAAETVRPLLDQRRHRLDVDIPDQGLQVQGDSVRLSQIVSNLLTNAARYTEPGGQIRVSARARDGQALIEVSDNGIGIHSSNLTSIFDMFIRGATDSETSQGGLGLGLAIASSLAKQHGGSLTAFSDGLGQGSRFELVLPLLIEVRPALDGASKDQGSDSPRPAQKLIASRALIVDDNRDAADMLSSALTALGHTTQVAYDGPSALKLLESFSPNVALLDIGLPVMDGHELARRFRSDPRLQELFMVALTGYSQEHDRDLALQAGFDVHLVKPVDIHRLDRMLREQILAPS